MVRLIWLLSTLPGIDFVYRLTGLFLAFALTFAPFEGAAAQNVVTSDAPTSVSVTVYRDPGRGFDEPMESEYLQGYALINEQRTVALPTGEVEIRFEGVAGGIVPQSAIITGLPDGVLEKNRDAMLLSPGALLNGHIGRRVTIRRTESATGVTRTYDADIRTGAGSGIVLQTAEGLEALQCTGLNETIIYPEVPEGLSAKPTLSVRSNVSEPTMATITLSYLAYGFDWQANYVANVSEDGKKMDLFAWVTLANEDETSFIDAQTQTVAGYPNKEDDDIDDYAVEAISIRLRCWPQGTTSDIPLRRPLVRSPVGFGRQFDGDSNEIIVTARRRKATLQDVPLSISALGVEALQESLGDLKLYRIPVPVTVAAKSQKQVAMFDKEGVKFEKIYKARPGLSEEQESKPLTILYRFRNKEKNGLGLPLPSGQLVFFQKYRGEKILIGQGSIDDKAIDEKVDVTVSESPLIRYSIDVEYLGDEDSDDYGDDRDIKLTVSNASKQEEKFEIDLYVEPDFAFSKLTRKVKKEDGVRRWSDRVPANGTKILTFRLMR